MACKRTNAKRPGETNQPVTLVSLTCMDTLMSLSNKYVCLCRGLQPIIGTYEYLITLSGMGPRINSSPPWQNGRHFGRRQFQMHFFNESGRIPIQITVKFVPRGPIDHRSASV